VSTPRQYCLTLTLREDDELIREYEEYHKPGSVWPEVIDSIREAGILDMQIYRSGLQLIMVMTVSDTFSFNDKSIQDSLNPKVVEWEQLMEKFQKKAEGIDSKWQDVPNIFELSKHLSSGGD
jgi:L-rhamnose mutarotase